jgi:NADPH:quinone reductase-like Zn-dependent oxidoreductase
MSLTVMLFSSLLIRSIELPADAKGIKPLPHIPGAEITGIIAKVGKHVTALKEGDKVVLYN